MNRWVLGITCFLGIAVFGIIWSVVAAINSPIIEDQSYLMKKSLVDTEINQIIQRENLFSTRFVLYASLNTSPAIETSNRLVFPYYAHQEGAHQIQALPKNTMFVRVVAKDVKQANKADSPALRLKLFLDYYQDKKVIEVGSMQFVGGEYKSGEFALKKGLYKAIFEVSEAGDEKKDKLYFQKEFIVY
ncbi:hypothetical protein BBW65_04485 [Helicobacter enhydrae]|uniref:Uncharacterized protein n=1 Tax=Helicobacter enhydrae TaxID=222136 RepID=A0A1B1U5Q0_9HELI|nr:hypothetical protein [Helicobacter enhydrae]ANV98103.1 hypothetical protein BBW65_04485 [Helicobacter enhydrae]